MKIVVVDGDQLICDLLRKTCKRTLGHDIIGVAHDGKEALEVIRRLKPDLVLLEPELSTLGGFGVIAAIKRMIPTPRILMFSSHQEDYTIYRIEKARIQGFVDKKASAVDYLRIALIAVSEGKTYFSEAFNKVALARRLSPVSFVKSLSDRQQLILEYIGDLCGDEEIAKTLGISVRTVEGHRSVITRRLGLRTKIELEQYARQHGFTRALG